ncbi:MAG: tRNA-queuosine alpha-mannosyltransferase domain-containing protein [Planctomycetota bacterium]|jgi:glycosyltransferase involved in cell wall biosynthesis
MNILFLEAYYGGSHKAFVDGWVANSRHCWDVLKLAANKWKWRMRHGAITFADEVNKLAAQGQKWDLVFCSDMLNFAEFRGLTAKALAGTPGIVYFHENQLTYPVRFESERDYQFGVTNITTALAATSVWFNSAFHCDEFLGAVGIFFKRMPDNRPLDVIERIRAKSAVYPPGIKALPARKERAPGPMRILWAARWEHDKNPEDFFEALKQLKSNNIDFRLSAIGPQFREVPEVFAWAKDYFSEHIDRWGYQSGRGEYESALCQADVIVSTARHEFFGISVAEAISAGAFAVLPKRLSYPEILSTVETSSADEFFYDGSAAGLAGKLAEVAKLIETGRLWAGNSCRGRRGMERFWWSAAAARMDDALEEVKKRHIQH